MDRTALVTGGGGGLGSAVVMRLLADGWRVVVPWIVEKELERLEPQDGLELVRAGLFEPESGGAAVALAAGTSGAPLKGLVNLVGGFAGGGRVDATPIEEFEALFRLNL